MVRPQTGREHVGEQSDGLFGHGVLSVACDERRPGDNISKRHCVERLLRVLHGPALAEHVDDGVVDEDVRGEVTAQEVVMDESGIFETPRFGAEADQIGVDREVGDDGAGIHEI